MFFLLENKLKGKTMQINNNYQYPTTPTFKQISLVKVEKSFFKEGTSALIKDNAMKSLLSVMSKDKIGNKTKILLAMLGIRKKVMKFFSFLEFPGYASVMQKAEDLGTNYSWFKQNSGIDFKDPMEENYDSFWVLTREDKDAFIDATPKSEINRMINGLMSSLSEKKEKGETIPETLVVAQTAKWMNDKFEEVIKGKEVNEIVIDDNYPIEFLQDDLDF